MRHSLAALAALVALLGAAAPPARPQERAAAPHLVVEPASFDFGKVRPAQRVAKEFRLRNGGSVPLRIESVTSTCQCTVAPLDQAHRNLAPGESTPLRVTMTTTAEPGPMTQTVAIMLAGEKEPGAQLAVRATVVGRRR
jgi:hypothetical protein